MSNKEVCMMKDCARTTFIDGLKCSEYDRKVIFSSFRKKPITIKAAQMQDSFEVVTLEGLHSGGPGDYLIIGIEGEKYPCKKRIFEKTYELV